MTYSKANRFDDELQQLAKYASVLSHPARLAILKFLASCETCISGDISQEIPLSRTTVTQHLTELKKVGLIRGEIDGVKVNYCIDREAVKQMIEGFTAFFGEISQTKQLNCINTK
ncbi:MAG: winged helix-turn-helix transcriptional regulator [Bacteroidales bacterium]|nr:winged helix-turn-helix transcriptional regulator [Bacteroidales bacterium]